MTPDRWSEVERLYHAALERSVAERAAFLLDACPGDDALRREVESLLAQQTGAAGFLSTPAIAATVSVTSEGSSVIGRHLSSPATFGRIGASGTTQVVPGQEFGAYRIERLLGQGGMGEVYEAEHLEHGRRVALKVLSQRLTDPTDRARFLREGQLAASVSDPHIVYIYGSEEIAGIPVIAMELLPGGTLKDRVQKIGPLSPVDAIDAVLQVVSGLEAAQAAGILHRDIKPSNCFVDADGTVKVGDFGLSIPTRARDVTQLTSTGTFHGTPQFASPEHLRGQQLDVRSDIYAVGATLHYLLTGRPPFDDRDLMALIARIVTEPPPSLRKIRPEIPRALVATVLQCLAKDPAHRPPNYRTLASVLEPFSSSVKTPAPLGVRIVAGVIDGFFSQFLLIAPGLLFFVTSRPAFGARPVWQNLVEVAYWAITESVWGASLGKALCGVRVVTEDGARPSFGRALVRALMFIVPRWFAGGLALFIAGPAYSQRPIGPLIVIVVESIIGALLFAPARRSNGFAGMHEWVSRTRTVLNAPVDVHRIVRPAPSPIEVPVSSRRVGPYVLVNIGAQSNFGAALAYDERLRRKVWLRFPTVDSDSVPAVRRVLRRPARPRWLAGQRTPALAWDAYEQVPGQPFVTLLTRVQSWGTVRRWLCDLAEEVSAGLHDNSLPVIEFDRIWIGDDGRARLLDWPVPSDRPESGGYPQQKQAVDLAQAERFLYRVAVSALDGQVPEDAHPHVRAPRVPLPLSATDCLAKLREQRFVTSEEMLTALASAARGAAAVSRTKRAGHVALCAIPTILILVLGLLALYQPRDEIVRPDIAELSSFLSQLELMERRGVPSTDPQYHALEVYVAGRHGDLISNPPIWSTSLLAQRTISSQQRTIASRIATTFPTPQKADVDQSVSILGPFLDTVRSKVENAHPYIRSVNAGEAADRAGLKANDVVVAVEGQPIWFGSQLRNAITTHPNQLITLSILRDGQPLMIRATPVRRANQALALIGIDIWNEERLANSLTVTWRYAWLHAIVGLMFTGALGMLSALAARGGIALRLTNIALVTRNGTLASRSRAALRAFLSWLPVFAVFVAAFAGHSPLLTLTPPPAPVFAIIPTLPPLFPNSVPPIFFQNEPSMLFIRAATITVAVAVLALAAIFAVLRPERGLQDRLAGTWLVPR
jgi:uncharacterized RDD family membrane protein YckC/membrane-associated protease RseP (regulator of RpoE activity)